MSADTHLSRSRRVARRSGVRAGSRGAALAAERLTWLAAGLGLAASLAGLFVDGVYAGPESTAAMLRGYDLVTAVVVVPGLGAAAYLVRRGSVLARLVATGLLAAMVYTYAYYLFGTGFNDLFLVHVVVFTVGLCGLVLSLAALDVDSVAGRFSPRTGVRTVAGLLCLLSLGLGAMWTYVAVDNAVTGAMPAGSALVETATVIHLGIALDLTVLVPLYAVAASLLWRRVAWGYVLAAVALFGGLVHQAGYLVAMPFQVAADIPGAVSHDPVEPVIVLVYVAATALLLHGARRGPGGKKIVVTGAGGVGHPHRRCGRRCHG